jgi:hypothetical protein
LKEDKKKRVFLDESRKLKITPLNKRIVLKKKFLPDVVQMAQRKAATKRKLKSELFTILNFFVWFRRKKTAPSSLKKLRAANKQVEKRVTLKFYLKKFHCPPTQLYALIYLFSF